jgi:hypothetical protein
MKPKNSFFMRGVRYKPREGRTLEKLPKFHLVLLGKEGGVNKGGKSNVDVKDVRGVSEGKQS